MAFKEQVQYIGELHQNAETLLSPRIHLVSTDEMTGIQALERLFVQKPMQPKRVERIEFEYIRHGTLSLIANWHIAKGQVMIPSLGATRTEQDFCQHISRTIDTDPDAGWIFIVDHLNIHQSESLVRLVARRCGIADDLGVQEKSGILKLCGNTSSFFV